MIDVRQLEYFLAVHDHGGVTRAAQALHLAQPSLSQAIRALERKLKVQLFHRVGRVLVLSPAGEALLEPARSVIRSISRAEATVRDIRDLEGGRVNVAVYAGLVPDPVAAWIGRFRRQNPGMTVRLHETEDGSAVSELVRNGECELGLTTSGDVLAEVQEEEISLQHIVLVSPPGTIAGDSIELAELSGLPLVVEHRDGEGWREIDRVLRASGVQPRIVVDVARSASVVPLILAGAGSAFLPLRLAIEAHWRGAVLHEIRPTMERRLRLLTRNEPPAPPVAALAELIRFDAHRWVQALDRQQSQGLTLLPAALAVDHAIRSARVAAGLAAGASAAQPQW
jgi:LysR family transcriptional regulator, nitrogen assimilation regulatory protein